MDERRRKMKRSTLKSMFRIVAAAAVLFVPLGATIAFAQPEDQQSAPRSALSPQQLDNLVAPLALYPDPILSQVLVAATYPLEVVEANQWLQQNRDLTGTALMDAAKQQNWDPSVQALVAFPDVLARLNQDVRWTTDLGNAFLGQQADVMSAVQRLRHRAQANGKLRTTPQETVTEQMQDGQSAISIQPADPQVVYVPSYDPAYIWGQPDFGYYPPLYYPTYGFGFGFGIPIGGFYGGWGGWGGWGWGCNWFGGGLFVNGGFFNHYGYRYGGGYGGFGGGYRGGFAGNRGWAHDYSRASRATGSGGYSRSYQSPQSSRAGSRAGNGGFRSSAGQQGYRGGANQSINRGGANQSFNRGGANQSFNRGGSSSQFAARNYGSTQRYSAPAQRYSGSSGQHYSAPQRSYSGGGGGGGGGSHFSGGGGGGGGFRGGGGGGGGGFHGGGGGGGGSHGGGGRR